MRAISALVRRWARPPTLGSQVFGGLALIAIAVASVAGLAVRSSEQIHQESTARAENEKRFELLVDAMLEDVIAEDVPSLETTLREVSVRDPNLLSVEVVNEDQIPLIQWTRATDAPSEPASAETEPFGRDIVFADQRFGRIDLTWDASAAIALANAKGLTAALIVGLVCLLMGVLVCAFVYGFTVHPIKRIAKHLEDFRHGTFDRVMPLPRVASAELRRLDESVNALGEFLANKKRQEADLQAAKDAAEAASRAKSEFLAHMSHELRTPLNAINGFSEMMRFEVFGALGNERYRGYAENIHNSGIHLLSLINDILDIVKIESRAVRLHDETVDLAASIRASVDLLEAQAASKGLRLATSIDRNLPVVRADARRLQQILLNLLSNAVKFTPSGGSISTSATWHESFGAIVKVADNGIGIPPEMIDQVFEPFSQVEGPYSREHGGSGLGLPLAKKLVELHGGKLSIVSRVDVGTEVSFTLPAERFLGPAANQDVQDPVASGHTAEIASMATARGSRPRPLRRTPDRRLH
jgi:signal transduction histidine kinase